MWPSRDWLNIAKGKGSHLHHEDFLLDDCKIVPRLQLDNLRTSKVNEGQSSIDSNAVSLFVWNWLSWQIVSDDKIQMSILKLRRGALSNHPEAKVTLIAAASPPESLFAYERGRFEQIYQRVLTMVKLWILRHGFRDLSQGCWKGGSW